MITMFLTLALSGFHTQTFTIVNPAYFDQNDTMVVSANKQTHEQLWFTTERIENANSLQIGDEMIGVFNYRWEEDQFLVFKK